MGVTHVEALKRLPGVEVAGILGSSPEKSKRAAESLSLPRGYESFDALLADESVNAVHITTPNRVHFETAKAALEAGKHVLCEKPLAMNTEESAALVELAASKQLAAGVNYNIRFYPLCVEARERVRSGDIGDVYSVFGSYVQDWLLHDTDYNWRVLAEEGGELRAIADIGTHWLDLVQSITGRRVVSLCADLHTVHPVRKRPTGEVQTFSGKLGGPESTEPVNITTEDLGSILLHLDNGARGCVFISQAVAGRKNALRFEIAGAGGSLAWDSETPNALWRGQRDTPNESFVKDPSLLAESTRRFADYPGGHAEGFPDTFKMCFRAFYDHIAAGDFNAAPDFPTFEEGHREIQLCEAVLASHRERKWVDL